MPPPAFDISTLPSPVLSKIMRCLCHCPWYGGHVNEQKFREDVYSFLLAFPTLYTRLRECPDFRQLQGEARQEDALTKFYRTSY